MRFVRNFTRTVVVILVVAVIGYGFVQYYSFIFAKEVEGEVVGVERISEKVGVLGMATDSQLFSFAVAVKDGKGEIFSASSEDRQWAVVAKGQCVRAKFYP